MRQNCSIKNRKRLKKNQLPGLDSAAPCPLVLTGPPGFTVPTSAGDLELQSNPAPRGPQRPAPPHTRTFLRCSPFSLCRLSSPLPFAILSANSARPRQPEGTSAPGNPSGDVGAPHNALVLRLPALGSAWPGLCAQTVGPAPASPRCSLRAFSLKF